MGEGGLGIGVGNVARRPSTYRPAMAEADEIDSLGGRAASEDAKTARWLAHRRLATSASSARKTSDANHVYRRPADNGATTAISSFATRDRRRDHLRRKSKHDAERRRRLGIDVPSPAYSARWLGVEAIRRIAVSRSALIAAIRRAHLHGAGARRSPSTPHRRAAGAELNSSAAAVRPQ